MLSALHIRATFSVVRSSGKTPLIIERINKYFKGSHNSLKYFLWHLKRFHHDLDFYLSEEKVNESFSSLNPFNESFSSLTDNEGGFILVLFLVIWESNGFIFQISSNVRKKLLNLSAIFVTSKMLVLLTEISVLEKWKTFWRTFQESLSWHSIFSGITFKRLPFFWFKLVLWSTFNGL